MTNTDVITFMESEKQYVITVCCNSKYNKKKRKTHRYREQTSGYPWDKRRRERASLGRGIKRF